MAKASKYTIIMKKKCLIVCSVMILGVLTTIIVKIQHQEKFSDIVLTNAEAIASGESEKKGPGVPGICGERWDDYDTICDTPILTCQNQLEYTHCQNIECKSTHGRD